MTPTKLEEAKEGVDSVGRLGKRVLIPWEWRGKGRGRELCLSWQAPSNYVADASHHRGYASPDRLTAAAILDIPP